GGTLWGTVGALWVMSVSGWGRGRGGPASLRVPERRRSPCPCDGFVLHGVVGGGFDSGGVLPPARPKDIAGPSACQRATPLGDAVGRPPPPALAGDARFARFRSLQGRAEGTGGALRASLR